MVTFVYPTILAIFVAAFVHGQAQNQQGSSGSAQYAGGNSGSGQNSNNFEPGYLRDYHGDIYTNPQRIQETQALNRAFFQSIGGEPQYQGAVDGPQGNGTNQGNTQYSQPGVQYNQSVQPGYGSQNGYAGQQQVQQPYGSPATSYDQYGNQPMYNPPNQPYALPQPQNPRLGTVGCMPGGMYGR